MSEYMPVLVYFGIIVSLGFIWLGLTSLWFRLFPKEDDEYGDGSIAANLLSFGTMALLLLLYFYIMKLLGGC